MTTNIELEFPSTELDAVAEKESWRKEIYRPNYHIHKWWANRLGSVFRAITIGALSQDKRTIWEKFYEKHDFKGKVVLDPFMGSGTTIGEALKLGATVIGCDINPVSTFLVQQGISHVDNTLLKKEFENLYQDVSEEVEELYKTIDPSTGETINVLYFFWVKVIRDSNNNSIPLFSSYIFSKNAYPSKKPESKSICPHCWDILDVRYDCTSTTCLGCGYKHNPQTGPVNGQFITTKSGTKIKIKDIISKNSNVPKHRLYAIMAKSRDGTKIYLKPTKKDFDLYNKAKNRLKSYDDLPIPTMEVREGHNTNQAKSYNYNKWRDFFNDRQLLTLGLLLKRILKIPDERVRNHLICLFSGTLEFNNLFCSFKGEGTGAVRHMFSNHILKPEKTPLENTVLGFENASGTFKSLFNSRLVKAKDYLINPFELKLDTNGKSTKIVCSNKINPSLGKTWEDLKDGDALILNGDSSTLPLPSKSIDAIITDPPYFDYVHYSELSDFFYAWLSIAYKDKSDIFNKPHCGDEGEVQDKCGNKFSDNLARVFREGHRVLKDDGVLVFSFHHSRPEGWVSIFKAIIDSGFNVIAAHPVKAEMSVGSPKNKTKNPINIDALLVCKKEKMTSSSIEKGVWDNSERLIDDLTINGRELSEGDKFVIRASQALIKACNENYTQASLYSFLDSIVPK